MTQTATPFRLYGAWLLLRRTVSAPAEIWMTKNAMTRASRTLRRLLERKTVIAQMRALQAEKKCVACKCRVFALFALDIWESPRFASRTRRLGLAGKRDMLTDFIKLSVAETKSSFP